jgi:ABC-type phosphate transport system permease subunit
MASARNGSGLFQTVLRGAPVFSLINSSYAIYDADGVAQVLVSNGSGALAGIGTGALAKAIIGSTATGLVGAIVVTALSVAASVYTSDRVERTFRTESAIEKLLAGTQR